MAERASGAKIGRCHVDVDAAYILDWVRSCYTRSLAIWKQLVSTTLQLHTVFEHDYALCSLY